MQKRKKFRKVLNIFLCVLSLAVVFSVTVFAKTGTASSLFVYDDQYNVVFTQEIDFTDYIANTNMFYIVFNDCHSDDSLLLIQFRHRYYDDAGIKQDVLVREYSCSKFEYVYDMTTGARYYLGDFVIFTPESMPGKFMIVNESYLTKVEEVFSSVFGVVTDIAEMVSDNALMLLFVIGLPVCSLGVGFLIRLKERT